MSATPFVISDLKKVWDNPSTSPRELAQELGEMIENIESQIIDQSPDAGQEMLRLYIRATTFPLHPDLSVVYDLGTDYARRQISINADKFLPSSRLDAKMALIDVDLENDLFADLALLHAIRHNHQDIVAQKTHALIQEHKTHAVLLGCVVAATHGHEECLTRLLHPMMKNHALLADALETAVARHHNVCAKMILSFVDDINLMLPSMTRAAAVSNQEMATVLSSTDELVVLGFVDDLLSVDARAEEMIDWILQWSPDQTFGRAMEKYPILRHRTHSAWRLAKISQKDLQDQLREVSPNQDAQQDDGGDGKTGSGRRKM